MRHNRDDRRFSRHSGHLRCMMANLTRDLLIHERIKTTTPKAKELRRTAEKMITLGKQGTMTARRQAFAYLRDKVVVTKLFSDLAPRFAERKGGYTRSYKVGVRHGDCAPVSLIELLDRPEDIIVEEPPKKKAKKKEPAKKESAKKESAKKETKKKASA